MLIGAGLRCGTSLVGRSGASRFVGSRSTDGSGAGGGCGSGGEPVGPGQRLDVDQGGFGHTWPVGGDTGRYDDAECASVRTDNFTINVQSRLRVEVDGRQWQKTFDRKGHADARARRLADKHALGWWFDPSVVDMVDPRQDTDAADTPTVFSTTLEYVRSGGPSWIPNTRRHYVRYLSRARRWLLRADAPVPNAALAAGLDRYTEEVSLRLAPHPVDGGIAYMELVPDDLGAAVSWLEEWSLPVSDLDAVAVRALLARYDYYVPRHPADSPPPEPARAKASTREAMARHTKTWWNWLRDAGRVTHDPFRAARRPAQAQTAARAHQLAVDPDIVLSPAHLFQFAEHLAAVHPLGDRWRIYVPLLGLEGLRPGEALGLRRRFFELPAEAATNACGWLVFDEQRPTSRSQRFVDSEDRDASAPLKGRDAGEARRVPIFSPLVPLIRRHLALHVDDSEDALVLTGVNGGALDPKWFARRIWEPAREAFVAELRASGHYSERVLRKLEVLRRHDLRHAAASFWLRVPVSPKLAQRWGGWRDLSTFLDVYQGVLVGEEDTAISAVSSHRENIAVPRLR